MLKIFDPKILGLLYKKNYIIISHPGTPAARLTYRIRQARSGPLTFRLLAVVLAVIGFYINKKMMCLQFLIAHQRVEKVSINIHRWPMFN